MLVNGGSVELWDTAGGGDRKLWEMAQVGRAASFQIVGGDWRRRE